MPVKNCSEGGKPGYKWGDQGKCYTYSSNNETSRKAAKQKAIKQGLAATGGTLKEAGAPTAKAGGKLVTGEQKEMKMAKKIKAVHVIKPIEIEEQISGAFAGVTEAGLDPDNRMISGVCVFGTRESANKRIYQDKAIASLANLTEGAKMFLNHPGQSEQKEHGGVRRIQEWAGIFVNARQDKDRVFADLKVREAYWDLLEDVATMQPHGVGNSINARVRVFVDDKGMESVVDMDALRSVDLVSSAATTQNLFESAEQIQEKMNEQVEFEMMREMLEPRIVDRFKILIAEGMIQDKVDNDKLRREISQVTWIANDLIDSTIYDSKLGIDEKKKKVIAIFDDLDGEIKKRLSKMAEESQTMEEENMEITLELLKSDHQDLIKAILEEAESTGNLEKAQADVVALTADKETLEATVTEQATQIETLTKENGELKVALDQKEVEEKLAEKRTLVDKLLGESKLPKEAKTDVFHSQLMAVEESGEGDNVVTVEQGIAVLIKDREEGVLFATGKPRNMGDDYDPDKDINADDKEKTATVEEATDSFLKTVGR